MFNSVLPQSPGRDMNSHEISLSEQLLNDLSPKIYINQDFSEKMHVNEFSPGEILGNDQANKLPPLKGKEAAFIPLHLAKDYVKKVKAT
jgi:hypothetical protein